MYARKFNPRKCFCTGSRFENAKFLARELYRLYGISLCTDQFKAVLDELDACLSLYPSNIHFAGDLNADPGLDFPGDLLPKRLPNQQGIVVNRYLFYWGNFSGHLNFVKNSNGSLLRCLVTFVSEALLVLTTFSFLLFSIINWRIGLFWRM